MALAAPAMSLPRDSIRSLQGFALRDGLRGGQSRNAGAFRNRPLRSPCGSKNRYVLHNDRRRECPTGPHRLAHSPRTGSSGELPARPDLRERISGTLPPTGVTGELFSTAFRWSSAWHSRDTARISNHYVHTLSKIDPQSEQLDGVEL